MGDELKGIAVILGIGLILILAVPFFHAHGPVNLPLSMTYFAQRPPIATAALCFKRHGRLCQF